MLVLTTLLLGILHPEVLIMFGKKKPEKKIMVTNHRKNTTKSGRVIESFDLIRTQPVEPAKPGRKILNSKDFEDNSLP